MNRTPLASQARLALGLLLVCFSISVVTGQNCRCEDCPVAIPTVAQFDVCYDVAGATNNDLAAGNQGVCGVFLRWTHDYIENLGLTLRSPSGQTVQLVGPARTAASTRATAGSRWAVNFVECGALLSPFPGTGPRFDGDNNAWQLLGDYSGTYEPFTGCLGDLNTGPVDGQWCISVTSNAPISNNDRLFEFELTFCDDDGIDCCYAEAPGIQFPFGDTTVCVGDSILALQVAYTPRAGTGYQDRMLVTRNDTILAYRNRQTSLRTAQAGRYRICPLSYYAPTASLLPPVGVPVSRLLDSILLAELCADLGTDCLDITLVEGPGLTTVDTALCAGQTLTVDGQVLSTTGAYNFTFPTAVGCDSAVTVNLEVVVPDSTFLDLDLCQGDTLRWPGLEITTGGSYQVVSQGQRGCDSTIFLEVTERAVSRVTRDTAFCLGEELVIGLDTFRQSGVFEQQFSSVFGCDSVLVWQVLALSPSVQIASPDTLLSCATTRIPLSVAASTPPAGVTNQLEWTFNGSPIAGANPLLATAAGQYVVEYGLEVDGVGCSARDTFVVLEDIRVPALVVPDTLELTCRLPQVEAIALPQSSRRQGYRWLDGSGGLLSTTDRNLFRAAGFYSLVVVDSLSFCDTTYSIVVEANDQAPVIRREIPDTLSCTRDSVLLDASASLGLHLVVDWFDPSSNLLRGGGGLAYAKTAGQYTLTVTDTVTGCSATELVQVERLAERLVVTIDPVDTLTCVRTSVLLTAGTSTPADLVWTDAGGAQVGLGASLAAMTPGTYTVTATERSSGCRVRESATVVQRIARPVVSIAPPDSLRCFPAVVVLDASATIGDSLSFRWMTSVAGGIVTGSTRNRLTVSEPGEYTLVALNQATGCTDTASVEVFAQRDVLLADAGQDAQLNCANNTVSVGGTNNSAGPDISYRWSGTGSGIVGFPLGPRATISSPGDYVITVRNNLTGCTARDTVQVTAATDLPTVAVADSVFVDCGTATTTLLSTGSTLGGSISYTWSSADGVVLSPTDGPTLMVGSSGTYRLLIQNAATGCEAFAETRVLDRCPAFATVTATDTINCTTGPSLELQATGSMGPGVEIAWTTLGGRITAGASTFRPTVDRAGAYFVEVRKPFSAAVARDTVTVVLDTVAPRLQALDAVTLACGDVTSCVAITAVDLNSVMGAGFTWSTLGGRFCSDTARAEVRINAPGLYEVRATHPRNGCSDIALLDVVLEPGVPLPDAGPDVVLSCAEDSTQVRARLPNDLTGLSWQWVDAAGMPISGPNVDTAIVRDGGQFGFLLSNAATGCTAADSLFVIEQSCAPDARPVVDGPLTCLDSTVQLSTPVQVGMVARWTTPGGALLTGFQVEVRTAGVYVLEITDTTLGNRDVDSVRVVEERGAPSVLFDLPAMLTCEATVVSLSAARSFDTLAGSLSFRWLVGPNLLGTRSSLSVGQAGRYRVEVENERTGCRAEDSILVEADTLAPIASAVTMDTLDCVTAQAELDATLSSGRGALTYAWQGLANQAVVGTAAASAVVREAGAYELLVRDGANGCLARDTVEVFELSNELVVAGRDTSILCGSSTVQLQGAVLLSGGAVSWSGEDASCLVGGAGFAPSVRCPGDYIFTWTTPNGLCRYRDTLRVGEGAADFRVRVVGDSTLTCARDSVKLRPSADKPVSFRWLGGTTTVGDTLTVDRPGEVTLVGTDAEGCADSLRFRVSVDTTLPSGVLVQPDTLTCLRTQVLLNYVPDNLREQSVFWSGPGFAGDSLGLTVRADAPGDFKLLVVDVLSGCEGRDTLAVAVDTVRPVLTVLTPSGTALDCFRDSLEIVIQIDNGQLSWVAPAGQAIVAGAATQQVSRPGIYRVVATHPRTGCRARESVIVTDEGLPLPTIAPAVSGVIDCRDSAVVLSAVQSPNVQLTWTAFGGEVINPAAVTSPGLYYVTAQDTVTGCTRIDSLRALQYTPTYQLTAVASDTLGCDLDEVSIGLDLTGAVPDGLLVLLSSDGGDSIRLTQAEYLVREPGMYAITTRDSVSGCDVSVDVTVFAEAESITNVVTDIEDAGCPGERGGLIDVVAVEGGTAPFSYVLNDRQPQDVGQFGLLSAGEYELQVTDADGCIRTEQLTVLGTSVKPVALAADTAIVRGSEVCIALLDEGGVAPDSVVYRLSDGRSCSDCDRLCVELESAVLVTATAFFGECEEVARQRIDVVDRPAAVWPTAFSPNGDNHNDTWAVRVLSGELELVRVYDRWGSIVFISTSSRSGLSQAWDGTYSRGLSPVGAYVVEVAGRDAEGKAYRLYGDVTVVR